MDEQVAKDAGAADREGAGVAGAQAAEGERPAGREAAGAKPQAAVGGGPAAAAGARREVAGAASPQVKRVTTPLTDEAIEGLRCGDMVSLTGVIYTARDAAHARMAASLDAGEPLPADLAGQVIYYAGPTPAKPGAVIGSCGPTTSGRMDAFTPQLLRQAGLAGMVGKGPRSPEVVEAIVANHAVYFASIGGAAAVIAASVKECEVIAYEDLGPEAVRRLVVEDYPCIVAVDCHGTSIYEQGPARWRVER